MLAPAAAENWAIRIHIRVGLRACRCSRSAFNIRILFEAVYAAEPPFRSLFSPLSPLISNTHTRRVARKTESSICWSSNLVYKNTGPYSYVPRTSGEISTKNYEFWFGSSGDKKEKILRPSNVPENEGVEINISVSFRKIHHLFIGNYSFSSPFFFLHLSKFSSSFQCFNFCVEICFWSDTFKLIEKFLIENRKES